MITGKKIWNPKCTLRSHLDGVRGLFFTAVNPILVTASEVSLFNDDFNLLLSPGLSTEIMGYTAIQRIK